MFFFSSSLYSQLVYPVPSYPTIPVYPNNCNSGCSNGYYYEPGEWAWMPRYPPCWYDCYYFAPKCYYQRVDIDNSRLSIPDAVGIHEGKKLNGVIYGLDFGYIWKGPYSIWAQVNFSYTEGRLKGRHRVKGFFAHYADVEGYLGYNVIAYNFTMVPYVGIGYSLTRERFEEETFFGKVLRERYHIIYIPFGLKLNWAITPCFEIGINVEGKPQADATLRTNLITHNRWELTKTTGYLVEIPICWNIPCYNYYWKVILIPFWKETTFGKSKEFKTEWDDKIFSPRQKYRDWGGLIEAGTLF
jgi:hypothetical protein